MSFLVRRKGRGQREEKAGEVEECQGLRSRGEAGLGNAG